MTNIMLGLLVVTIVICTWKILNALDKIYSRLDRIPRRVTGHSHGGAVTYYTAD